MAPPPPAIGSDLHPAIETTNVRMVSEYVLMDIAGYSSYPSGHANVTAQFFMRNLGDVQEQMKARFPMNLSEWVVDFETSYLEEWCDYSPMPSLDELRVWVNGVEVNVEINYETMIDYYASPNEYGEDVYITVPCWAHFDVTFPPEQDVVVKVTYTVAGYNYNGFGYSGYGGGDVEFAYVLGTGAGWKDTIGKADIVARLPYDVNSFNFIRCEPEDCVLSGKEISWHFEDFEPEGNVALRIVRPSIWQQVLDETENTKTNPNDGEAWGRLAKAYKDAITGGKGQIGLYEPREIEMFMRSQAAYQRAVELLPHDADWHYGFADLLCNRATWSESTYDNWHDCLLELKDALDINPNHQRANDLLEWINMDQDWKWINLELVDLSADQPVFLLLSHTPAPSPTVTDTLPPSPTRTKLVKTRTPTCEGTASPTGTATNTPETQVTPSPTHKKKATATVTAIIPEPVVPKSTAFIYFGGFLVIILGIILVIRWKNR
jgi:hypothetical protein